MIELKKYSPDLKVEWNDFVLNSVNGTFLFLRDYMDYHSDRFEDLSFLIYADEKLVGLLPGNISGDVYTSHGGLTYGGVIIDSKMKSVIMLDIFQSIKEKLAEFNITTLVYKGIPHIYHREPSESDLYALFRNKAENFRKDLSSTINLNEKIRVSSGRNYQLKKAKKEKLSINHSQDFPTFWKLLSKGMKEKYNQKPVHSIEEIQNLVQSFPEKIELWTCEKEGEIIGGLVMYNCMPVAHVQYMSANEIGKELGALDLIIDHLIGLYRNLKYSYFDFGISTEKDGTYLNEGLVSNKESYGARTVVYDHYRMKI